MAKRRQVRLAGSIRRRRTLIVFVICFILGSPLLLSGAGHLANMHHFLDRIYGYDLLPVAIVPWVASFLPALTTTVGVCLVIGVCQKGALLGAASLFLLFAGAQTGQLWWHESSVDCGCFVWFESSTSVYNVGILVGAAATAIAGYLLIMRQYSGESLHEYSEMF
ncbi:MAG TPA: MauE/DoxX family redox-associated membrane protein [Pirellulaceae bacterium]|nr:MauE/DoxX family redox-associated membrane protein [Pirellulaceae bacterium]HMO94280.1 MauE/DoxX family redox-associated membrane protein [Pirellulaceae bacterium]HMP70818.1 MauE/DoxX family redox-associated membrane protein [Pirellulaceae bacterium]